MKQSILVFVVFLAIAFSSCRKEYTCECKTTRYNMTTWLPIDTTYSSSTLKDTKSNADIDCELLSKNSVDALANIQTVTNCNLK